MMKSVVRILLVVVLVADMVLVLGWAGGFFSGLGAWAEERPSGDASGSGAGEVPTEAEALARLGRELAQRLREVERREAELAELARSEEVLRRAGIEVEPPTPEAQEAKPAAAAPAESAPEGPTPFDRLRRAYENMEPDTAARALAALARKDREVVIALLAAWNPRVSGAILDALTRADAALAAELSYEVWTRSGKPLPPAAQSRPTAAGDNTQ